jgi:hypothetical protein
MTEPTEWRTAGGARVTGDAVPTVVQQRNVPEAIRSLNTLGSPDYVDVFTVASAVTDKSPEQWARATVEGLSPWARFVVWRVLCGLRLGPQPSPDSLAGWKIADRGDSWIRMEASSWFMTARVLRHVRPLRQANGGTRVASAVHRPSPSGARPAALRGKAHQPNPMLNGWPREAAELRP